MTEEQEKEKLQNCEEYSKLKKLILDKYLKSEYVLNEIRDICANTQDKAVIYELYYNYCMCTKINDLEHLYGEEMQSINQNITGHELEVMLRALTLDYDISLALSNIINSAIEEYEEINKLVMLNDKEGLGTANINNQWYVLHYQIIGNDRVVDRSVFWGSKDECLKFLEKSSSRD